MLLDLAVIAPSDADPASDEVRALVEDAAARVASQWSPPVFTGSFTAPSDVGLGEVPDGYHVVHFVCHAIPKAR